ncbi:hypothetical protein CBL_06125 [Carabus blaptoides fortunei]
MSSQAASEARTVPVIQSVAESAAAPVEHEPGIHFLTDDQNNTLVIARADEPDGSGVYDPDGGGGNGTGVVRSKSELLEYLIRDDGSVTCKLCGEVLASRTHWYRHKYKLHVPNIGGSPVTPVTVATATVPVTPAAVTVATTPSTAGMSPSPLFRCAHCNVFFKSRKGYMGHVSARHSTDVEDELLVTTDALVSSDTTSTATSTTDGPVSKTPRRKETCARGADWEQQREKEEKLVADIIDRVRKECEAQGAAVSRRGYSRRSTVMNTCN